MKPETEIETPRLVIRSWRKTDRDATVAMWCDPENGKYMTEPVIENVDEKYLSLVDTLEDEQDGYNFFVELKDGEKRIPVGTCCAFPEEGNNYDIGYCIAKGHWKEGLGTEMISALIEWIRERGGRSVTGEIADDNAGSVGLVRKLGFHPDRKSRYKKRGEETYFDAHFWKLEL